MLYLLRRLAAFPLTLLGVSAVVFVAIRLVPGDAVSAMLGSEAGLLTPVQRASLAGYFGIDQPWPVQYGRWLLGLLRGDLGLSVTFGRPVLGLILGRLPLTLELAFLAIVIALLVGIPAGVFAATRRERLPDLLVRVLAMLGQSTPSFVLALLLIFGLSVGFGVLPAMGDVTPFTVDPLGHVLQLLLPAAVLGFAFAASVTRITRSAMIEELGEDYVLTARAKGVPAGAVIRRHALPNTLIPVVTLGGLEFGYLLGGTVVVEQVFALPGLGRLVLDAITQRDYALVQGAVLVIAANFMLVNLLVDVAYAALDPRIRLRR